MTWIAKSMLGESMHCSSRAFSTLYCPTVMVPYCVSQCLQVMRAMEDSALLILGSVRVLGKDFWKSYTYINTYIHTCMCVGMCEYMCVFWKPVLSSYKMEVKPQGCCRRKIDCYISPYGALFRIFNIPNSSLHAYSITDVFAHSGEPLDFALKYFMTTKYL